MAKLEQLVNERMDELLQYFPISFWQRLKESMTWSEEIGDEEIQFDVDILE